MYNTLKMSNIFLVMCLPFLSLSSYAQYHYILENLKATKENEKVILTWTIRKGNTCEGIGILRSTDRYNYEPIGKIYGVCGSSESSQSYFYIDESPVKNKINYYVLELGLSGKTDPPVSVEIIGLNSTASKVVPNPAHDIVKIYFINPNNEEHLIFISDTSGKFVTKGKTTSDYFFMDFTHFEQIETASFNFNTTKYTYFITDKNNQKIASGVFLSLKH
jgi:hypothetical protein